MLSTKILALFALFSVSFVIAENKAVFSKHEEFADAKVSGSLWKAVASYSVCHGIDTSPDGKHSFKCSITSGNMADKSTLASCDVTFQGKLTDHYTIHSLSADKILFVWFDDDDKNTEHLLRYTFIHLPDCKTAETTVAFDDQDTVSNIIAHYGEAITFNEDGTYDVFYENPKTCGDKVCRLTLDSDGKIVKGPITVYVPNKDTFALTENTPINNSVAIAEVGIDSGKTKIFLITSDGQKVMQEFNTIDWTDNDLSAEYGQIRGCSIKNKKVECELFDSNGNSVSKNSIDLGNHEFYKLGVHNLPHGEFALFTQMENEQGNITKYDANNKRVGSVEVPEHKGCGEDAVTTTKDVYIENNQLCISRVCYSNDHADVVKNCFNDGDLK